MSKRSAEESGALILKRSKQEEDEAEIASKRTSSLAAPNLLLEGHTAAVYSLSFDPSGQFLASASLDKSILLWDVYKENKNYNQLLGHKNGVTQLCWASSGDHIYSSSADKSVAIWDAHKGSRVRKYSEHTGIINCCATARDNPTLFASGSDDKLVHIYDTRSKYPTHTLYHAYPILSVALSNDGTTAYTGGIDNVIRSFDLRKEEPEESLTLTGHQDTLTGLALSPDNHFLLSNSMDNLLVQWDVRPFVRPTESRWVNGFQGFRHGAEKVILRCAWSPDQSMVACGSADRIVHVWDTLTTSHLYYLPGHKGSVNDVIFHPKEPIIASCSSDKTIFLGELNE